MLPSPPRDALRTPSPAIASPPKRQRCEGADSTPLLFAFDSEPEEDEPYTDHSEPEPSSSTDDDDLPEDGEVVDDDSSDSDDPRMPTVAEHKDAVLPATLIAQRMSDLEDLLFYATTSMNNLQERTLALLHGAGDRLPETQSYFAMKIEKQRVLHAGRSLINQAWIQHYERCASVRQGWQIASDSLLQVRLQRTNAPKDPRFYSPTLPCPEVITQCKAIAAAVLNDTSNYTREFVTPPNIVLTCIEGIDGAKLQVAFQATPLPLSC
jgi:hypothetical protein